MLMALRAAATRGGFALRRHGGKNAGCKQIHFDGAEGNHQQVARRPGTSDGGVPPLPQRGGRNRKQQCLEIPAMIRTLSLPRGAVTVTGQLRGTGRIRRKGPRHTSRVALLIAGLAVGISSAVTAQTSRIPRVREWVRVVGVATDAGLTGQFISLQADTIYLRNVRGEWPHDTHRIDGLEAAIPRAAIESLWAQRGTQAGTGAVGGMIVGGVLGALILGFTAGSHLDNPPQVGLMALAWGGAVGLVVGTVSGSMRPGWKRLW